MAKKPAKSESLTLRLDPKTRFMLEFVARVRGQTITTVFERAIQDTANNAIINDGRPSREYTWQSFWNIEEGIRVLSIARNKLLRPTYEEEKLVKFTEKFWPFFYLDFTYEKFHDRYIAILWDRIDDYMQIDERSKKTDFWEAGKEMAKTLINAKVAPPEWEELLDIKIPNNATSRNLDDDIPF